MDTENLDSLFEDALKGDATQPTDAPAGEAAPAEGSDTGAKETPPVPQEPTEEEKRSRNAEKRIRREQRIAEQARSEERARISELVKRLGIEKSDGSVIDNLDALEAYEKAQSEDRIARGQANADDIRRLAREAVQPGQTGSGDEEVQRQLDAIRDIDPEMTDLGAILNSDLGQDFKAEVEKGATFLQAYGRAVKAANARAKGTAASSAAKAAGKGHLSSTSTRGEGALPVPADEMALIRELNPGLSDAEIQKYYNADRKKFGR